MSTAESNIDMLIREVEAKVAREQQDVYAKQSFDGSLRVNLDEVFVSHDDGLRAIERLKAFSGE